MRRDRGGPSDQRLEEPMRNILSIPALLVVGACASPTYVRPAPSPPPPAPVVVPSRPPPVIVPSAAPDPRLAELARAAQAKRAQALHHHQAALELSGQANNEQAAADRDFFEARRLDRESFGLLRDQRRVQAQTLWQRADREDRDAALIASRAAGADADAAREDATARDEAAAAARLREGAARETDPGQRRRLEDEARALETQSQGDAAEAQQARQSVAGIHAQAAQLKNQAVADRAAATQLEPRIAELMDPTRAPVPGVFAGSLQQADAARALQLHQRAAQLTASGRQHQEAAARLIAQSQAEQQTADRLDAEARGLDHQRYALTNQPGRVQAESLWLRADDTERRAQMADQAARGHRARAEHFRTVSADEHSAAARLTAAATAAGNPQERQRLTLEAAAISSQADQDASVAQDEALQANRAETDAHNLHMAAARDRDAARGVDPAIQVEMGV
jgi:hypothetical protein